MSSSTSSSTQYSHHNKLHPIYVALDAHQYNRAVKLASALPDDFRLGQALLAHALQKSGQRYKCLLVIQRLLTTTTTNNNNNSAKCWYELEQELFLYRPETTASTEKTATSTSSTQQQPASSSSKRKKGKKKAAAPAAVAAPRPATRATSTIDWTNNLDQPPVVPKGWDDTAVLLANTDETTVITDETTLSTLSLTLQTMRMYVTVYQMYACAAAAASNNNNADLGVILQKSFLSGLYLLLGDNDVDESGTGALLSKQNVLGSMQVTALQLARLNAKSSPSLSSLYTAWAARTALWQLDRIRNTNVDDVVDEDDTSRKQQQQRQQMLPRLAESLASKVLQQKQASASAEDYLLYLETLAYQNKWDDMLQELCQLEEKTTTSASSQPSPPQEGVVPLAWHQIMNRKADVLVQMQNYMEAQDVYEQLLWTKQQDDKDDNNADDGDGGKNESSGSVDQWSYWMGHLTCSFYRNSNNGGDDSSSKEALSSTESFLNKVLESLAGEDDQPNHPPPVRAPYLMQVELAAVRIRGLLVDDGTTTSHSHNHQTITPPPSIASPREEDDLVMLQQAICAYALLFASHASCAFSDLCPYIELLLNKERKTNNDNSTTTTHHYAMSLLEWAASLRRDCCSREQTTADLKQKRSRLRCYIFSVKMTFKVIQMTDDDAVNSQDELIPSWTELVKEWRACTTWTEASSKEKDDQIVQKENQPGDELILLAVQQLLYNDDHDQTLLVMAAFLLESALCHSPDNAYIKITAMNVYSRLNAVARSWELYQSLNVKHIQLDSCLYLVLSMLVDGGLYDEAIQESSNLLKFHATTTKDSGDFTAKAMERGTLSKANEFLVFQRQKMNASLSLLDVKGRIMDCAPLLHTEPPSRKKADGSPRPLAVQHGIIGVETDLERAVNMIKETHNPLGAPNTVALPSCSPKSSLEYYSDNRDVSILSYEILRPITTPMSKEQIFHDSMRRGHIHGLLIRATLCVDACKGPKKGKVQKNSDALEKRCTSLLSAVTAMLDFVDQQSLAYPELLNAMSTLCRVLVIVCAGMPPLSEEDSLSERERRIADMLPHATSHAKEAKTALGLAAPNKNNGGSPEVVATVCRLLPDCIVALFALLEMNGSVFSMFGWGKRKHKTKSSAAALADFALAMRELVSDMRIALSSSVPNDSEIQRLKANEMTDSVAKLLFLQEEACTVVDETVLKETVEHVVHGQRTTRDRVAPFLDHIMETLGSFDVADES